MNEPFDIVLELSGKLVRATTFGVLSMEEARSFVAELGNIVGLARRTGTRPGLLLDVRLQGANPLDVGDFLRTASLNLEPELTGTAIVVNGAIHTMQANRLSQGLAKQRVFSEDSSAVAWLNSLD